MSLAQKLESMPRRHLEALPAVPADPGLEARLSQRVREGDLDAFVDLVERHRPVLRRVIQGIAQDPHLSEDLVQDTVLRAARNLHRFDGRRFSAWILRIGVNLTLTALRRQSLGQKILEEGTPRGPASAPSLPLSPLERMIDEEDSLRLRSAMEELPARHRRILEMRYASGMRCCEIADALETTPNTISIILCRARHRLRRSVGVDSEQHAD